MRFLIVGAGAVGACFGARLLLAGHELRLVARGEHGRVLASRGLVLREEAGESLVGPFAVGDLDSAVGYSADVVLIAVKAPALAELAPKLSACLGPKGYVVPLLNGLESEDQVAAHVGEGRVLAAVAYMSGELTAPGELCLSGPTRVGLAPYRRASDARVASLAETLTASGIPALQYADAGSMLWQKMLWNVPFNALCALIGREVGAVVESEELLELARTSMCEVAQVAAAEGSPLPDNAIEAMIAVTRARYARTRPSMLQDVQAGRVTEVGVLQDAVVRRGLRAGLPTPVTRTLAALVRARHPRT